MQLLRVFVFFLILIAGSPGTVHALRVQPMTMAELLEASAAAFIGTVTDVDPAAGLARGDGEFGTAVTFQIEEVLAGSLPRGSVTFELGVGKLGGTLAVMIPGLPQFKRGATYLMFAAKGEWPVTPVTNWTQGLLQRVSIDGERYYADSRGRVVLGVGDEGFVFGERVVDDERRVLGSADEPDGSEAPGVDEPDADGVYAPALPLPGRSSAPGRVTAEQAAQRVRGAPNAGRIAELVKRRIEDRPIARESADLRTRFRDWRPSRGRGTP